MNEELMRPFDKNEVTKALFDLNPNKAPGPDGFPAFFFQKEWDLVQNEVINTVLGVLNGGEPLDDWNNTIITLIPKVKSPLTVKDYRPISLCNVLYKIIARAITNRLKSILEEKEEKKKRKERIGGERWIR